MPTESLFVSMLVISRTNTYGKVLKTMAKLTNLTRKGVTTNMSASDIEFSSGINAHRNQSI